MPELAPSTTYFLIRWANRLVITAALGGAVTMAYIIKFIPGQPSRAIFYASLPIAVFAAQWLLRQALKKAFARYRAANFAICIRCGYKLSDPSARCTECGDTTPQSNRQAWWHQCSHQFSPSAAPPTNTPSA